MENQLSRNQSIIAWGIGLLGAAAFAGVLEWIQRGRHRRRIEYLGWRDYLENEGHIQRPEGTAQEIEQESRAVRHRGLN